MKRRTLLGKAFIGFALWIAAIAPLEGAEESPFGLERRSPWTTSRVVGSPDGPLPYTVERFFTNIAWKAPIFAAPEPGTDSLVVVQQGGEQERPSKILRLRDHPDADQVDTLIAVSNRLVYSVAFHPGYRTNRHLFLFSNGPTPQGGRTNRISRFPVAPGAVPECDPKSERVIIEWRSAGHDGGDMVFGHDGMLYVSTGDGTSDSDGWNTGQDLSDLLGGVLRLDVDRPDDHRAYSVPKDNPFVGWTNTRPELWAYGLRNPWRMTIDRKTGQIWVGNNGQDLWETAHAIRRGENYGWSVYEGSHPFYLNRRIGPTPVIAPTIEHHHAEARSLTGGVVYYGDRLPELEGAYVYGDYSSGTIWGARYNGSRLTWHKELTRTELLIAGFALNHHGELLIIDHGGGIHRLVRPPRQITTTKFPMRLSETGLFLSTKDHRVHPGLVPYSVNAAGWADGAQVERFIGLPEDTRIELTNGWTLPNGTVLMQTLSLPTGTGAAAARRIETRLLTRQQGQWAGYSYRWNAKQSDAALVPSKGEDSEVVVRDSGAPGGKRRQTWRHPGRTECMGCHSRAAGFVLGFTELQLNKVHDYGAVRDDQLRTLQHLGLFAKALAKPAAKAARLVDPYDSSQDLDARARSYLHVNCSVCHVDAGGGNARMELGLNTKPEKMNLLSARPQHDTFGIDNAMLVAPGDPGRSILYQRVSRRGRGGMPPLVSALVDERAAALFREWIGNMKPEQTSVRDWKMEDLEPALERVKEGRCFEPGQTAFRQTGCNQCHRFAGEGGSVGPDLAGVGRRLSPRDLLESILLPSNVLADGHALTEIETRSGEVITGRVEHEDERQVSLRPALGAGEVLAIRHADIRQRTLSRTSNMPSGIVNSLTETQILDLLAYLISDGDAGHAAFRPNSVESPAAK